MKRNFFTLSFALLSLFVISGCPLFFYDKPSRHSLMSAEELVEKMNSLNLDDGCTFILIAFETTETEDCKILSATLEASTLPGKTVTAMEHIGYDTFFAVSERTTFISVGEWILTDYYAVKYQDEIESFFATLYEPVLEGAEYALFVKPNIGQMEAKPIADFPAYKKNAYRFYKNQVRIKKEFTDDCERKFNSLCYDMLNSEDNLASTTEAEFYFSGTIDLKGGAEDDPTVTKMTFPF